MRAAEKLAGVLSLLAGGVHGVASPEHFSSWWGYGLFFLAATLAQLVFGLLLLTRGIEAKREWSRLLPSLCLAGIVGNLAIMALWLVTRTLGVPAGPEAGEVEPVGVVDAVSKVLEAALVLVLARLWVRSTRAARHTPDAPEATA